MEERIQKLFSGLCSRRTAERYIREGRVSVNGRRAVLGERADPERDTVLLDGRPLPPRGGGHLYLLLNKPRGYVTTLSDERGRRTVADLVAGCGRRVWPVGRLDMASEGLLLLTDDGELSRRLTHPSSEVEKTYLVTVSGELDGAAARLAAVRDLDGDPIRPARVEAIGPPSGGRTVLSVTIHEGKNRQIRRMCEACGLTVHRLRRIREHGLGLGDLPPGRWRPLTRDEIAALGGGTED